MAELIILLCVIDVASVTALDAAAQVCTVLLAVAAVCRRLAVAEIAVGIGLK
jgi:hypothetical protein